MQLKYSSVQGSRPASARLGVAWLRRALLLWDRPLWSMALALVAYTALTRWHSSIWHLSPFPYYNYLADAFLHARLGLRLIPPTTHDLSLFGGQYYLYWAPLPAILMMPFVALFGVGFSDVTFTLLLGAINVLVVTLILRHACHRRVVRLSAVRRALLVMFFALGTVHTVLAPHGRVWFTGQLVGFLCVALAYLAVLSLEGRPAFALAGLALGGALLTRNHLVVAGLWPGIYLLVRYWQANRWRLLNWTLSGLLPILVAITLLGLYNLLRFGSVFENGIAYHQMSPFFAADYQRYGAFNLHYLPINVQYQYIAYPFPLNPNTFLGGSLFLLSPVFFAMLWGLASRPRWSAWLLFATIMLVNLPILLLMGTGWIQFGPRYTLDFTVPLLLLTALGARRWPVWLLALLTAVSIIQYIIGAYYFGLYFSV